MKLHRAPTKDGVGVTVTTNLAVKSQSPKKGQRDTHGPLGQNWNSNVVLLQEVFGVYCRLASKEPRRQKG
jgi:hypothetical protein